LKNKTTKIFLGFGFLFLFYVFLYVFGIKDAVKEYNKDKDIKEIAYGNVMLNAYLNAARDFNCYLPKVSDLSYGTNKEKIDLSSTMDNDSICKPEQKETILRAWRGPYALNLDLNKDYYSFNSFISIIQDKENLYFQINSRTPTPDFKDVATKYCIDNKEYLADCSATEEKLQIKLLPLKEGYYK
jgi:hypothetical protein